MSDNREDLIAKLASLEQQLIHAHENHNKISEIQAEIFRKIDDNSKQQFDLKAQVEALLQTNELEIKGINKAIEEVKTSISGIESRFSKFKTDKFEPLETTVDTAEGTIKFLKVLLTLIIAASAVGVAIYFGVK